MKISIVTPRFAIAGVPLAQIRFARALVKLGHQVTLVVGYVDPLYQVPNVKDLNIVVWNRSKVRDMLLPLIHYLREEKPEVVFSAEDHLNTILLIAAILTRSKAKISGSSRVTPFDTYSNTPFSKRWVLKQLSKAVMWRANALTCVSSGTVEEYKKVFNNPPHVCVYNIIDDVESQVRMKEEVNHPWVIDKSVPLLVAAGRLAPWKNYADLIKAIAILKSRKSVRLLILGDGPLRNELQIQINELNLSEDIKLLGYVENPLKYFKHAKLFVHSALVESLGNVLVEAMLCGCTPVSTDCPTGPREVLQGGKYGYLVPVRDPAAMADGIEMALDHPISKELLAEAVRPFEEGAVLARHFEVLGLSGRL